MSLVNLWHSLRGTLPKGFDDAEHWQHHQYLVLDMETTGLEASKDNVISLGWVLIENGAIKLNSARHILLNSDLIDGKNMEIHMITDQDIIEQGRNPSVALRYLRQLLLDKVLVVHHAPMDIDFLKRLWPLYKLNPLSVVVLDTLAMEQSYRDKSQEILKTNEYRLPECRFRYGLPDYASHDALTDALATAELLLAQINHAGNTSRLRDLIQLGGNITRFS